VGDVFSETRAAFHTIKSEFLTEWPLRFYRSAVCTLQSSVSYSNFHMHDILENCSPFRLTRFTPAVAVSYQLSRLSAVRRCCSMYLLVVVRRTLRLTRTRPRSEPPPFAGVLRIVKLDLKGVARILIANESAISCMSLRTTVQILQVRRPHTRVGSQLTHSTQSDMGQNRQTDRRTDNRWYAGQFTLYNGVLCSVNNLIKVR